MSIADTASLPVAVCLARASPHEVKLAKTTLDSLFIAEKSEKLICDKAYDSDKLNGDFLNKKDVEMIAPHRHNRTKPQKKLRMAES